jgi:hypothetical protein
MTRYAATGGNSSRPSLYRGIVLAERPSSDLEVAKRFRAALETAVRTGERDAVLELVASDVEWVTAPAHNARDRGAEDLARVELVRGSAFDFEFSEGEWAELGDGRVVCDLRPVYRTKERGDVPTSASGRSS